MKEIKLPRGTSKSFKLLAISDPGDRKSERGRRAGAVNLGDAGFGLYGAQPSLADAASARLAWRPASAKSCIAFKGFEGRHVGGPFLCCG